MEFRKALGRQIREARGRNNMSQQAVVDRLAALGVNWHQTVIGKIEAGNRSLAADELLALSIVLNVAVVHLIAPFDDDVQLELAPELAAIDAAALRQWVRGSEPLPGQDARIYRTFVPDSEWEAGARVGVWATQQNAATVVERMQQAGASDAEIDAAVLPALRAALSLAAKRNAGEEPDPDDVQAVQRLIEDAKRAGEE